MEKPVLALVEDNADNRMLARALLEGRYQIVEFASGPEALEGFRQSPPDVVLLDLSLPGMDGTQVLEQMRASESLARVPVVAFTAHALDEDRDKTLAAGFDGYVTKPILDESILLTAIENALAPRSD